MTPATRITVRLLTNFLVMSLMFAALDTTPCRAAGRLSIDGYFKSFVVCFDRVDFDNNTATQQEGLAWATTHRARANAAIYACDRVAFHASYELSLRVQDSELVESIPFSDVQTAASVSRIYRVADLAHTVWPDHPGTDDHAFLLQNLDRAYVAVTAAGFDLFIGRQAIAWGSARAVNPTDVISPFLYTDIDTEDRAGTDAIRLRVPAGALGELDLGYVAGEDFRYKESAGFVRGKFYVANTDVAIIGATFHENALMGIDITRAVGGAGTWCEAAYVWSGAFGDRNGRLSGNDYLRLSSGADYNLGRGVYAFIELHYNSAGHDKPGRYLDNVLSNSAAYRYGGVYLLGRYYVIPGVSWQIMPLATLFAETLVNVSDGSFVLAPSAEYSVSDNLYVSLGGYAAIGKNPEITSSGITLRSEFGTYPDQYYAFLRYYF